MLPPLSETILSCTCEVRIHGKRSGKGWRVARFTGKTSEPAVIVPCVEGKEKAVQTALDLCAESFQDTFILSPIKA